MPWATAQLVELMPNNEQARPFEERTAELASDAEAMQHIAEALKSLHPAARIRVLEHMLSLCEEGQK